MNSVPSPRSEIRVGEWDLDLQTGELRKPGAALRLQEQPLQILQVLVECPGKVVSREDLRKRIWPADTFVDFDHGLYSAIKRLRDALGDSTENPIYIETLPRRGYRLIAPVTIPPEAAVAAERPIAEAAVPGIRKRAPRRFERPVIAILGTAILLMALLLGTVTVNFRGRLFGGNRAKPIASLAVLPLENLSADPDQEYFADGMTDELITDLAQLGKLRVISRTSVMHYKGTQKTLPQIARELNVDAVIEGSVARSGDRVRIRVQLIRGEDDLHLWARAYDRESRDVLLLQRDAAEDIAGQIGNKLEVSGASGGGARARPIKPEAFESYLKGRYFWNRLTRESNLKAIGYFEHAIQQDPDFAQAYSGLADAQLYRMFLEGSSPRNAASKAKQSATRALEIDPKLAEAHASLGQILEVYEWKWDEAEKEYRRAIELDANYVPAHQFYALYLAGMGRFAEALAQARLAQQLDPVSPFAYASGGAVSFVARQYDSAIEQCRKALEINPNFPTANGLLSTIYFEKGAYDQGVDEFDKLAALSDIITQTRVVLRASYRSSGISGFFRKRLELDSRGLNVNLSNIDRAWLHAKLGEKNKALELLQEAWKERDPWIEYLGVSPQWDSLRAEPRFHQLLREVRLPES